MKPVCLVIGAGAGIGGTVGKKFAREGYHAVLCRRSDEDGLNRLVDDIKAAVQLLGYEKADFEFSHQNLDEPSGDHESEAFNIGVEEDEDVSAFGKAATAYRASGVDIRI